MDRIRINVKTVHEVITEVTDPDGSKRDTVLATFDTALEAQNYKKQIDDPPYIPTDAPGKP